MEVVTHVWNILILNPPGHEGFGFNGNVLDTNLLNLAVVLGLLIYFGGDFLGSLLENRKQTILESLQDAEKRYQEAIQKLDAAVASVNEARANAESIRSKGQDTARLAAEKIQTRTQQLLSQLSETKQAILDLEEEKAVRQVSQQVATLALKQAREDLVSRLASGEKLQNRIVDRSIGSLSQLAASTNS